MADPCQLQAVEAILDLIECFDYSDESEIVDLTMEEIPRVLGNIGADAVKPLTNYTTDSSKGLWSMWPRESL